LIKFLIQLKEQKLSPFEIMKKRDESQYVEEQKAEKKKEGIKISLHVLT